MPQKRSQLVRALRDKVIVKFTRPFEDGSINGYVIDIGPRFFLVAVVEDSSRFNGFQCFRLSDVRELEVPGKYAAFVEAALKKRGERIPKKPSVDVRSIQKLILTANRAFPLVTIHRERVAADECHIGRIVELSKDCVSLLEIGPNALWDKQPETYRLKEITRIDFGCDYEASLHLVGGLPMLDS